MKVREFTVKFVTVEEVYPDVIDTLLSDPWPDWLVGIENIQGSEITREATETERASMGIDDEYAALAEETTYPEPLASYEEPERNQSDRCIGCGAGPTEDHSEECIYPKI